MRTTTAERFGAVLLLLATTGGTGLARVRPLFGATDPGPCAANAAGRQLDYWLGSWVVTYPGTSGTGTSTVQLSVGSCLLTESWASGGGLTGENLFAYDLDDKRWHGLFVDTEGRVHPLEGSVTPGSAEFRGPSRGPNGEAVLNRIRVVRITADKLEQSWEKSIDNGATWRTEFRGEYTRQIR